jgi:hypothetical protein
MRILRVILGIWILALLVCVYPAAVSQERVSPSRETYTYDVSSQKVTTGIVVEVKDYKCPVTGTLGSHIALKRGGDVLEVHLAPAAFLKQYEIVINKGDEVAIEAAPILFEGKPALLAKTVAVNGVTYAFRDAKGQPLW